LIQKLKDRNPLLVWLLAVIFVIVLCCILPAQIFYWTLCTNQDRNIPPNMEVLVSSCKRPTVIGVPGGEVLFVHEERTNKMYLLDLRTGEQRKIPNYPLLHNKERLGERLIFLDPNLVLVWGKPIYILDLTDGQKYELLNLTSRSRVENGNLNSVVYSYLQSADRFFIDRTSPLLIALSTDFRTNQNGRVILAGNISDDDEFLLKLVKSLEKDYVEVDSSRRGPHSNMPSPTGAFLYRDLRLEGVRYSYRFRSWYYDDSGVVIHDDYGTYWLQPRFLGEYGWNFYHLSLPVLKMYLPEP
jgi:hypothetical protein